MLQHRAEWVQFLTVTVRHSLDGASWVPFVNDYVGKDFHHVGYILSSVWTMWVPAAREVCLVPSKCTAAEGTTRTRESIGQSLA